MKTEQINYLIEDAKKAPMLQKAQKVEQILCSIVEMIGALEDKIIEMEGERWLR